MGLGQCLILAMVWRLNKKADENNRADMQLKEKMERLMKKQAKEKKKVATKKIQTNPSNVESEVRLNIFHPRYCSTPVENIFSNNNRKRSGIPRSTTFPRSAQLQRFAQDDEFQSEFEIPLPFDAEKA